MIAVELLHGKNMLTVYCLLSVVAVLGGVLGGVPAEALELPHRVLASLNI